MSLRNNQAPKSRIFAFMNGEKWSFSGSVPSRLENSREFIKKVIHELENRAWPDKDIFAVRMALEEAIVNAIKHGNQCDPVKSVLIESEVTSDQFYIEIQDEGPGFDPDEVPDCTDECNLSKPSGRGVMLIRHYMSEVDYLDRGTRIVMSKIRSDTNVPDSDDGSSQPNESDDDNP